MEKDKVIFEIMGLTESEFSHLVELLLSNNLLDDDTILRISA